MYTINIYKSYNQLEISFKDIQEENLNNIIETIEGGLWLYCKKWYEENTLVEFRIEVIDQTDKDIRNIIWESKEGFLEACSIKKYIQHLINKETYQIWINDHADSGICKFAD